MTEYRDALTRDWTLDPEFSDYLRALERVYGREAS